MSPAPRKYALQDLAKAKAELAACEAGSWPRDLNDYLRWQNLPPKPYDPPCDVAKAQREYVTVAKQDLLHWKYVGGGNPPVRRGALRRRPHTIAAFETPEGKPLPGHAVPIGVPNHFVMEQAVCTRKPS